MTTAIANRTENITRIRDGENVLEIGTVRAPFDQSYPALTEAGFVFHPAEQEARARRLSSKDSYVSRTGTYVNNAHIYLPKESGIVLIVDGAHNPILKNPTEATDAHRNGKEIYVDASQLRDLAKEDPRDAIKSGVLLLRRPSENPFEVPIDGLADETYFQFLLEDEAQPYGQFLKSAGISAVPVDLASQDYTEYPRHNGNSFARLLWVGDLDGGSEFGGNGRDLDYGSGRVRGVRPSASAVSASPQNKDLEGVLAVMNRHGIKTPEELDEALSPL